MEISLDLNLENNCVRYKFDDSPVLSVSIFETENCVIILVATVCSIHRLTFPHPNKINGKNDTLPLSIFNDVSANSSRNPSSFYVIGQAASSSKTSYYFYTLNLFNLIFYF